MKAKQNSPKNQSDVNGGIICCFGLSILSVNAVWFTATIPVPVQNLKSFFKEFCNALKIFYKQYNTFLEIPLILLIGSMNMLTMSF